LDRKDGETATCWLYRLDVADEAMLDASELSYLQALRQQASVERAKEAGDQTVAESVARQPGETATEHLARFQRVDKDLLSIDHLVALHCRISGHKPDAADFDQWLAAQGARTTYRL